MSLIKVKGIFSITGEIMHGNKQRTPYTATFDISTAKIKYGGSTPKFAGEEYLYVLEGEYDWARGTKQFYRFFIREYPLGGFNYDDITSGASAFRGKPEYVFDGEVPQYSKYA